MNYLVSDTELTSIANAIRTKGETADPLVFPAGFVSAVEDIPTGGGTSDFEVNAVTIITNKAQTYMFPTVYDDTTYPPNIVSPSVWIRANTPTTLNLLFYKGRCYTGLDNSMWGMTGVADYDEDYGYWYFTGSGTVSIEYD
jgi:hypothetical protein